MINDPKFISFFETMVKRNTELHESKFKHSSPKYSFEMGRKYIKIIRDTSVYGFVNQQNGDVLKAASWSTPAKGVGGNIFNDDNGQGCCHEYSIY